VPYILKKLLLALTLFFTFFNNCTAQKVFDLTNGWEFRKIGDNNWSKAMVPGTLHTDLLNNHQIEDPYYRTNEKDLKWIGREDWEYRTTFNVTADLLKSDRLYLVFKGLDTYADVYVNGMKVLVANNMFRTWQIDVKPQLKNGDNNLRVYFHSPIKTGEALYNSLPFRVPVSDNDQASPKVSVFTRKAGYHYGWDWGPRLVTSGIWRSVYLQAMNGVDIQDLFIRQKQLTTGRASLQAIFEVESLNAGVRHLEVFADGNPIPLYSQNVHLDTGITHLICSFNLMHPQLWWPNGYGTHKLYNFKVILKDGEKIIADKQVRHGMRTVEMIQESNDKGNSFYFLVNGVKIFMKGANYIPQDNFLPRVTKERYQHLISTAVLSNMNMLRVWGGGIYENDLFYDLCDENGILIYQDFMFACAMVPPLEDFKQNIYEEAVENVKRLRNHPSIAMYCGNNEVAAFMGSNFWGTAKGAFRDKQDSITIINTYKDVFHNILPAVVKAYDDDRFYWSTSPQANNYSLYSHDSRTSGDEHYYWDVARGTNPMEVYIDNVGPFMTEYGFQSFPDLETIKTFALPADYDIYSDVMKSHQRSYTGNGAILNYMKKWYKVPADFGDFLYTGQVLQAEGIKLAIEAHRRAKPFCMGSLYWQLDDCWPVASWSSMDYYGHWKALQYEAKRGYAKILVSPILRKDTISVFIVSDSLKAFNAQLQIRLMDLDGHVISEHTIAAKIPVNSSNVFYSARLNALLKDADRKNLVLSVRLLQRGKELSRNNLYFENPKDLKLIKTPVKYTLNNKNGVYVLHISAACLLKDLRISAGDDSIIYSDNYFDLLPGETKTVTFKSSALLTKNSIHFKSINDVNE
jgi:beta-mannosidase